MQERENQTGSSAEEPRVRVMSEDEARDYQGVTIEERKEDGEQRVEEPQDRYGRAVGGAAVVAFLVFVALPVLLAAAGIGVAAWLLLRFFRG